MTDVKLPSIIKRESARSRRPLAHDFVVEPLDLYDNFADSAQTENLKIRVSLTDEADLASLPSARYECASVQDNYGTEPSMAARMPMSDLAYFETICEKLQVLIQAKIRMPEIAKLMSRHIDPDIVVKRLLQDDNAASVVDDNDVLSEALQRGQASMDAIMADDVDYLPLKEAARVACVSEPAINNARLGGKYYALLGNNRERGYRYPKWQFSAPRERLASVLSVFKERNPNCWDIHFFMQQPNHYLAGRAPKDVILDTKAAIEPVLRAAHIQFDDSGAA